MSDILVIAEAGSNHCGNLEVAKKLIYEAKKSGADAIKFQLFRGHELYWDKKKADEIVEFESEKLPSNT